MSQDPLEDMTRIVPMLSYEDVGAALEWLAAAFGFRERLRYAEPDGLGPKRHAEGCELARRWRATPYVID